ncbi:MAG: hypothetical protein HON65_10260 [Rhodospirillales bacterium]|jgi:surface carbohydrate biosynthesis protein|nr:hypothetical protein [Rhodospirillales bacterium]
MLFNLKRYTSAFFNILATASFKSPAPAPVLVVDQVASDDIRGALKHIPSSILPVRGELQYISPRIISLMIRRNFEKAKQFSYGSKNFLTSLFRFSWNNYADSIVAHVGPKIIITFIDNYQPFYTMSERNPGIIFIAVQNGTRTLDEILPINSKNKNPAFLFCFGEHDRDLYSQKGYDRSRITVAGSLRQSLWKRSAGSPNRKYDVCIISEWRASTFRSVDPENPGFREACHRIYTYMARLIDEEGIKCCFAINKDCPELRAYIEPIFGNSVFIAVPESSINTYDLLNSSKLAVSVASTTGREAIAVGCRSLIYDTTDGHRYYDGEKKLESIHLLDPSYDKFKTRVLKILAQSDEEYDEEQGTACRYAISTLDKTSSADLLYDFVKTELEKKQYNSVIGNTQFAAFS